MHGRTDKRTHARTFLDCTGGAEVGSCFGNRTRLAQTRCYCFDGLLQPAGGATRGGVELRGWSDIRLPVVEGRLNDSFVNGEVVASRCSASDGLLRLDGGKGAAERMMMLSGGCLGHHIWRISEKCT
ncbi:unnamed protein product [Calypogeia fissa]